MNKLSDTGDGRNHRFASVNWFFPCALFLQNLLPFFVANSYPTIGSINISGTFEVGQTLTVSNTLTDADGMGVVSYEWHRDNNPIRQNYLINNSGGTVTSMQRPEHIVFSSDGNHSYVAVSSSDAVVCFERNSTTGALIQKSTIRDGVQGVDGLKGASCVTLSTDGNFAYVTGETDDSISWFSRNLETGALTYLGSIYDPEADGLDSPQKIALSADNNFAYVTADGDNSVSWFSRDGVSGALTYVATLKDGVGGADGLQGAKCITFSSDGNFAYITGYHEHTISWFSRDAGTGALTFVGKITDGDNAGSVDGLMYPVDVILSPSGKHAFVTSLQDDAVSWFSRDAGTGALTYAGMVKDGVSGAEGLDGAYGLNISADGNFLYVTGQYNDSIAMYDCNVSTGALSFSDWFYDGYGGTMDGLDGAQMVLLSPGDSQIYVLGWEDNSVSWYDRNSSTGALTFGGLAKNGDGAVDGLDGALEVIISADGNHAYVTGYIDDAVSWYERNASTGALTYAGILRDGVGGVDGLDKARSVTLSDDGNHAYVTGGDDDSVGWYERNASTGALTYGGVLKDGVNGVDGLDRARSVKLSGDGKHAYVTGGDDDSVSWYERNASTGALSYIGNLKDGVGVMEGLDGANTVTLSVDGKHAYVTGYIDDAVSWYERNASTGALTFGGLLKDGLNGVEGLNGARDIVISGGGNHVYVTGENDDAVGWYERNASTGALTYGGLLKDGLNGVEGLNGARDIGLSSDENYAYVTGSVDDSVSWFSRNASTGALTYEGILKDGVNGVRRLDSASGVTLSGDGKYAYVTGYNDDSVSWFPVDPATGALSHDEANQTTYTLTSADVRAEIKVKATHTDLANNIEQKTSGPINVANSVPMNLTHGTLTIDENQPTGTMLGHFSATDADGDQLTYSMTSGLYDTHNGYFSMDSNGTLRTVGTMDFEGINQGSSLMVRVKVSDGYGGEIENHGMITFNDLNEIPSGSVDIAGNAEYGQTLTASNTLSDPDGSIFSLSYKWYQYGGPYTGANSLKNGATINLDQSKIGMQLVAVATYSAGGFNNDTVVSSPTIVINGPPADLNSTGPLSVSENGGAGILGQFASTDPNGDPVTYSLVSGNGDANNSMFQLDSNGTLSINSGVDFEANPVLYLRVQAADDKNSTTEMEFTVSVNNLNENPTGVVTISGTAEVGQTLTALNTVSDPDGVGSVTYDWLLDGNLLSSGASLALDQSMAGGVITVQGSYMDGGGFPEMVSSNPTVAVNSPPSALGAVAALQIDENSLSGTQVGVFIAVDLDGDGLAYSLVSGAGDDHNSLFLLDINGTLTASFVPDYESAVSYSIRVRVEDGRGGSMEESFSVQVNNLDENPVGTVAVTGNPLLGDTLTVTDTINDPDGMGSVVYGWYKQGDSYVSGNRLATGSSYLLGSEAVNYQLTAVAHYTDGGGFSEEVVSTVTNLVNGPPVGLASPGALEIQENQNSGSYAGEFNASDPNGDLISYTLVSGAGDTNNSVFSMDVNGTLFTSMPIDYESCQSMNIRVRAEDTRGGAMEGAFTVQVINLDEAPTGSVLVSGNPMLGDTLTVTDTISDPDGMGVISYGWYKQGDNHVAGNRLATGLSYTLGMEAVNFQLQAVAHYTDGGGYAEEVVSSLTGLVNGPPQGLDSTTGLSVVENQAANSVVGVLNATDPNGDVISYSLVNGVGDDNNSILQLDANGSVRMLNSLDYELTPTLSIRARAEDGKGGAVESAITIPVGNVIEDLDGDGVEDFYDPDDDGDGFSDLVELAYPSDPNDPNSLATQNPYDLEALNDFIIIKGQPQGTVIGGFAAKEPDGESVSFSLSDGNDSSTVLVDANGTLKVGNASAQLETGVVKIMIKSSDPWGAFVEKEFEVMVFSNPADAVSGYLPLEESVPVGTEVGSFATVEEENASSYSYDQVLVGGVGDAAFEISPDGLLKVAQTLDYETVSTMFVGVRVTDAGGDMRVQYFGVNLINETKPVIDAFAPVASSNTEIRMSGEILDTGSIAGVSEVGFLISNSPILEFNQTGVSKVAVNLDGNGTTFQWSHQILNHEKIYFRAYGESLEGVALSLEETFLPDPGFQPTADLNAIKITDKSGWWESPWFGTFYGDPENGWIYHSSLGWAYAIQSPVRGVWLWCNELDWLWTDQQVHPFFYSISKANWFYMAVESSDSTLFFDYLNNDWFLRRPDSTEPKRK